MYSVGFCLPVLAQYVYVLWDVMTGIFGSTLLEMRMILNFLVSIARACI
jgi:hypothetical protein